MAAPITMDAQLQSVGELMASLNFAYVKARRTKPELPFLEQIKVAVKMIKTTEEPLFPDKKNWMGSKNSITAASRRRNASKMIKKSRKTGDTRHVLMMLSQCIGAVPYPQPGGPSGEELALAFIARSNFFMETRKYALCASDIDHALAVYPDAPAALAAQWMARKDEALANQAKKSRIVLGIHSKPGVPERVQQQMSQLLAADPGLLMLPQRTYEEHPTLTGAADCLDVKPDPDMVTRVEATRDIKIGDIILVERPFASVLIADCYVTHCNHCLSPHDDMIPCKTCSMVLYCTERCRDADVKLFHGWECPLIGSILQAVGLEAVWLPLLTLRIFLVAVYMNRGLHQLLDFVAFLDTQGFESSRGFDADGRYELPYGYPMLHYSTRGPTTDTEVPHLAAVLLLGLDGLTDFFTRYPVELDQKMQVGALLIRYGVVARDLVHDVENVTTSVNGRWRAFSLASAVYPVSGLFKHSCAPNTIRAYRGDNLVVMATANIAKGEQITCSYGVTYLTQDRQYRQNKFVNYPGYCKCEACVNDWPMKEELTRLQPTYKCCKCRAPLPFALGQEATDVIVLCQRCRWPNNILTNKIVEQEVKVALTTIRERITNNEPPSRFAPALIKALGRLSKFLHAPDAQLVEVVHLLHESLRHGGGGNRPHHRADLKKTLAADGGLGVKARQPTQRSEELQGGVDAVKTQHGADVQESVDDVKTQRNADFEGSVDDVKTQCNADVHGDVDETQHSVGVQGDVEDVNTQQNADVEESVDDMKTLHNVDDQRDVDDLKTQRIVDDQGDVDDLKAQRNVDDQRDVDDLKTQRIVDDQGDVDDVKTQRNVDDQGDVDGDEKHEGKSYNWIGDERLHGIEGIVTEREMFGGDDNNNSRRGKSFERLEGSEDAKVGEGDGH